MSAGGSESDGPWESDSVNLDQLGMALRKMYEDARRGEKTTSIHLFGIKYADRIELAGVTGAQVLRASGLRPSYLTELHKGIRLARHVVPRDEA